MTIAQSLDPLPLSDRRNRVMWLTDERVFYAGLLGDMSVRTMGAWLVYASMGAPLRIAIGAAPAAGAVPSASIAPSAPSAPFARDGLWRSGQVALVPPYQPHRVACDERLVCVLVIEPETVDPTALPAVFKGPPGVVANGGDLLAQLHTVHARLCQRASLDGLTADDFDRGLFGQPLAPRRMDARIARVLAALARDPSQPHGAEACAAGVGLSFSRFLHLFKQETGVSFRSLRSWKRARSLLHRVNRPAKLAHLALDIGYPDSTHFSHSIRQVYGLKPRDLFAGSRALTIVGGAPSASAGR